MPGKTNLKLIITQNQTNQHLTQISWITKVRSVGFKFLGSVKSVDHQSVVPSK